METSFIQDSLLQTCHPVHHHGHWEGGFLPHWRGDQKTPAIRRGHIVAPVESRTRGCLEQHFWNTSMETSSHHADLYGHHLTAGEVEQLLTVSPPAPTHAAIDRYLPFARVPRSGRKRLYVDLIFAALIGLV